jgi:hypothetical protein
MLEGEDIGHYGRLVFAMIARHLASDDDVVAQLRKDRDCSEEDARTLLTQVEAAGYSQPKRAKILEYQAQQDFPIVPDPENPDDVYERIAKYREEKSHAASNASPRSRAGRAFRSRPHRTVLWSLNNFQG